MGYCGRNATGRNRLGTNKVAVMGRPPGAEQKGRRIKAALLRYADAHPDKLDELATKLWGLALRGDVMAMKELADRIDGKVPQGHGQDEELGAIQLIVSGVDRAPEDSS